MRSSDHRAAFHREDARACPVPASSTLTWSWKASEGHGKLFIWLKVFHVGNPKTIGHSSEGVGIHYATRKEVYEKGVCEGSCASIIGSWSISLYRNK